MRRPSRRSSARSQQVLPGSRDRRSRSGPPRSPLDHEHSPHLSGRGSFQTPHGGQRLLNHLLAWTRHDWGGDLQIERAGGGNPVAQSARAFVAPARGSAGNRGARRGDHLSDVHFFRRPAAKSPFPSRNLARRCPEARRNESVDTMALIRTYRDDAARAVL